MELLCSYSEKCQHKGYSPYAIKCMWGNSKTCKWCVESNVSNWKIELNKIEQCPQRQDSLTDQIIDLYCIANRFGLYDAADYIRRVFIKD